MPRVATSGFTNVLRAVLDTDFSWSAGDTGAKILALTENRDFFLPGPATDPAGNLPADGDFYDYLDPLGLVTGGLTITIHGGGYAIGGEPSTYVVAAPLVYIRFIFCSTPGIGSGGAWVVTTQALA